MTVHVQKRNGTVQEVNRAKLVQRVEALTFDLNTKFVSVTTLVDKVLEGINHNITTAELDNLLAETCAYMSPQHPDYSKLAGRLKVSSLHKFTSNKFSEVAHSLYHYIHELTNEPSPLLATDVYNVIQEHSALLDAAIRYERDYVYDYFGYKTLERSYLLKLRGKIVERPQHMLMRVAIGIHKNDITAALETYDMLSQGLFTHASPTLFSAGTPYPQMSSCFLLQMKQDSIDGIYDTLKTCALISKSAGGIGVSIHKIRASGSYIKGTNGVSNGIVPMLKVFNDTARYVDQGGGKRKGSFAMYLEPWHADIFQFLDLRKNNGKEELRARDLFMGLWVPDLFMKRVEANGNWTLFCPNEAPGLPDVWGEEFEALYEKYESEGRGRKTMKARELWFAILDAQIETGVPYIVYKDACNRKSNQQNLGTIQSSNLCTEIVEYTSPDEVAVCNLASIALPKYVDYDENGSPFYDHNKLAEVVKVATRNLNKIIDGNYYPVPEARNSNMRHRPIGLGVQGLADAFIKMKFPFDSAEAAALNREIFETIYFAALTASNDIAAQHGPYETYAGSPVSKGVLQFDMWNVTPTNRWDWTSLRQNIAKHGIRNSLLVAPMPTASTSQILGNNECFEPYTSNLYIRRVLSGEFPVVNSHLVKDLCALNLWTPAMINKIIAHQGSIQHIEEIPTEIKNLYKTAWEIKQRVIIDMAADRGAYICQSQSMNVFFAQPDAQKLTSMHFYAWHRGLKTGMYYMRTRPAADAIQFTVDSTQLSKPVKEACSPSKPIEKVMFAQSGSARPLQNMFEKSAAPMSAKPPLAKKKLKFGKMITKKVQDEQEECLVCGS